MKKIMESIKKMLNNNLICQGCYLWICLFWKLSSTQYTGGLWLFTSTKNVCTQRIWAQRQYSFMAVQHTFSLFPRLWNTSIMLIKLDKSTDKSTKQNKSFVVYLYCNGMHHKFNTEINEKSISSILFFGERSYLIMTQPCTKQ